MEYLEQTDGYGWWGKNENKDFYENLKGMDNPWNWIRVIRAPDPVLSAKYGGGDHAGEKECAILEYLYPGSNKFERLADTDDWFAQSAINTDLKVGEGMVNDTVDMLVELIKNKG